jgi:hypothetical protein
VAPGRYLGEFDAEDAGSYFVMVSPGPGRAPIRTGVNVSYSDEFRERDTNVALLKTIASLTPKGGKPGLVIEDPSGGGEVDEMVTPELNPFRRDLPKSTSSQDIWHLLMLVACLLFLLDVFNRRVQVSFAWAAPLLARIRDFVLRREPAPAVSETMSRLQSRKEEIGGHLEQRRAATRFEPTPDAPVDTGVLDQEIASAPPGRAASAKPAGESLRPEQQEESYTERLLKAKKKVWDERGKKGE